MKNYKILDVYDFDGTLFNTAEPETGKVLYKEQTGRDWPFEGWWGRIETLQHPFITSKGPAYNAFIESKRADGVFTVLMTGRPVKLKKAVISIVASEGLQPDRYYLNPGGVTVEFKMKQIKELIKEFPEIKEIRIWEDRVLHAIEFLKLRDELSLPVAIHLVK